MNHDPDRQVEAIWRYLSLGDEMMLPAGLVADEGEYELEIGERPRLVGVFMEGVSPRTVLVGDPEGVHYAFDVENSRLANAWRGRFFNAEGTWRGRAGHLERPGSMDTIDLTPGVPFARVAQDEPWPEERGRQLGYKPLGRRFDADGRPTFRYRFEGVEIEESLVPMEGGLRRRLRLSAESPPDDLILRAAAGELSLPGDGTIAVNGRMALRLRGPGFDTDALLNSSGRATMVPNEGDLRIPVAFESAGDLFVAEIEMEVTW